MIISVCCICKIKYGEKEDGKKEERESHGYCVDCFESEMEKVKKIKALMLDQ